MSMPAIAEIGHNSNAMTPFELSRSEIMDLYEEAKNFCDGEEIATPGEAEAVSLLLEKLRKAAAEADERRVEENRPFDEGKKAVQAKYAEIIGDTKAKKGLAVIATEACKSALTVWLLKIKRQQDEVARIAREEAEAAERAAQKAFAMSAPSDIEMREQAERLAQEAKSAAETAKRAESQKAHAKGGTRAVALTVSYEAEVVDPLEFARFVWKAHPSEIDWNVIAQRLLRAGNHKMPGVKVHELHGAR